MTVTIALFQVSFFVVFMRMLQENLVSSN